MVLTANAAFTERHMLESVVIPAPAAGVQAIYTVPGNMVIQVVGLFFSLTTDANVSDRRMVIFAYQDAGTGFVQSSVSSIVQAASLAWDYHFSCGVAPVDATGDTVPFVCSPLACGVQLQAGERLYLYPMGVRAGDQLSACIMRFYEWKED